MKYWLFKSEVNTWSWDQQKARGEAGEHWDGVRNYQARNNMRQMKVGDRGFFYHSLKDKCVVGIVEVIREFYPDFTDATGKFDMVDIKAICDVPQPVSLEQVKKEPALADMVLANNSRLSVQPVTEAEWIEVCRMGGVDLKDLT